MLNGKGRNACTKKILITKPKYSIITYMCANEDWQIGGYMGESLNTKVGDVLISNEVIAKCAGASAVECFGVVGMAAISVKDGLAKLLKVENLRKGVKAEVEDNQITIDMHIIVSYGVNIPTVCRNLVENVQYKVEEFTGLSVKKINIYVEGVRVID